MKKRISIYIDECVWENLKEHAWKARKSASGYLENLIRGHFKNPESHQPKICDYCGKEHDPRVGCPEYITRKPIMGEHDGSDAGPKEHPEPIKKAIREKKIERVKKSGIDDNKLQEANDRLLAIRKEKGVTSLTGQSGPHPKVGKKGAE